MKSPWIDQKSLRASASSLDSVGWGSSGSHWSSPLRSSIFTVCFRLGVGSRNSLSLPNNLAAPSAIGNMNSSPFCETNTSFALILSSLTNFWCVQFFQIFQIHNLKRLLSKFTPRSIHTQERYQVIRSCQIGEVLIDLALKSGGIQPLLLK